VPKFWPCGAFRVGAGEEPRRGEVPRLGDVPRRRKSAHAGLLAALTAAVLGGEIRVLHGGRYGSHVLLPVAPD
jgi:hypothetical protein